MLKQGVHLTILSRNIKTLEASQKKLISIDKKYINNIQIFSCDVMNNERIMECLFDARKSFGPVELLINNAGQAVSASVLETSNSIWTNMIDVNLTGAFYMIRSVLPDMTKHKWGRIINIASTAGQKGYPYVAAYVASKHGLVGLTRAVAMEYAGDGITTNAVCPGFTDTNLFDESIKRVTTVTGKKVGEARDALLRYNPEKRLIKTFEVASTVSWLCSQSASAINGQSISVSCGEVM